MPGLRALPGTYALVFGSSSGRVVRVGKCGRLSLKYGCYIYIGSAFGPGGISARIAHHRRRSRRPHWHLDYLAPFLSLRKVWYTYDPLQREHAWAELLLKARGASVPLDGFGASDCGCRSHLCFFSSQPSGDYFRRKVHARIKNHDKIFIENACH